MTETSMKPRKEFWRDAYRANRYLAQKPESHLAERFRYLNECITTLTDSGQLGFEGRSKLGLWLWAKVTHTLYEFELRGLGLPAGMLAGAALPNTTYPIRPKGVDAYANRKRNEEGQLFKFGKRKRIESMLLQGEFKFAGASTYQDPSLNPAIRDDELDFTIYPALGGKDLPAGINPMPGSDWIKMRHPTDYYVQCFSTKYALRLFDDFPGGSCLVIYDGKEFGRRLLPVLRAQFPNWIVGSVPVSYIDPDDPGRDPIVIPAAKHMKYAYQNEERIVCHPRTDFSQNLPPIVIQIGSLEDIAEMITIV
jgi:hypothetical protein